VGIILSIVEAGDEVPSGECFFRIFFVLFAIWGAISFQTWKLGGIDTIGNVYAYSQGFGAQHKGYGCFSVTKMQNQAAQGGLFRRF
jgi:hypothetical protein